MLLSLFLLMLAQDATPQPAPNNIAPELPPAIQLAEAGRNAEALVALQKLAAANPNDHLVRLWIAQVHDRMGHPALAEGVYHSIVLEDPRNVDALVGYGITLLERDRVNTAIDALERAEQLAPQNPNVLAALGKAYRRAGRTEQSLGYFERAATISPTSMHRLALEQARREHRHRLENHSYDEQFNGSTPDTRGTDFVVNVRVSEALRVFGRGQLQRKFGRGEDREGGGAQWRLTPLTTVSGHALVGTDNRVLPQADYLGRIDYSYHRASGSAAVRYFDFFGANVLMFSPAVTVSPIDTWTFNLRYAVTTTDTALTKDVRGHTVQLDAAHQIRPRVWAQGGYIYGVDDFDSFSVDRIGRFKAHTGSVGVRFVLPSLTSIVGSYDYQRRANAVRMGRINISLVQSF